jgi:hypothetical protein
VRIWHSGCLRWVHKKLPRTIESVRKKVILARSGRRWLIGGRSEGWLLSLWKSLSTICVGFPVSRDNLARLASQSFRFYLATQTRQRSKFAWCSIVIEPANG